MKTLADFEGAFTDQLENEDDSKWAQGDLILQAITSGLPEGDVIAAAANLSQHSERQMRKLRRCSETFPREHRELHIRHSLHMLCAYTAAPYEWLQWAIAHHAAYTTLETAIKAAGDSLATGKPVPVIRSQEARCMAYNPQTRVITFVLVRGANSDASELDLNARYIVNVMQVQGLQENREVGV